LKFYINLFFAGILTRISWDFHFTLFISNQFIYGNAFATNFPFFVVHQLIALFLTDQFTPFWLSKARINQTKVTANNVHT